MSFSPLVRLVIIIAILALGSMAVFSYLNADDGLADEGCDAYLPASNRLVAHAGGGLPERSYANNRAAIDRAAANGFELIEIDFLEEDGALLIGHDSQRMSDLTLDDLIAWLRVHPDVRIVTDIKTDNLSGLEHIRNAAGELQDRFIPQIYQTSQYSQARSMGYQDIIFAERHGESENWEDWINQADLFAVTIPHAKLSIADSFEHPVFLYTVNEPVDADVGLYTDCLIPQR